MGEEKRHRTREIGASEGTFASKLLKTINVIIGIICIGVLVVFLVVFLSPFQSTQDIIPVSPHIYYYFIGSLSLISVFFFVGACTVGCRMKKLFILHTFIAVLLVVALVILGVFSILYQKNKALNSDLQSYISRVQIDFENALVESSIETPEDWFQLQNRLECCGVDAGTLFSFQSHNKSLEQFVAIQLTGDECGEIPRNNEFIQILSNISKEENLSIDDINHILFGSGIISDEFFCFDKMSALFTKFTPYIVGLLGIIFFLFFVYMVSASRLLCKFSYFDAEESHEYELFYHNTDESILKCGLCTARLVPGTHGFSSTATQKTKHGLVPPPSILATSEMVNTTRPESINRIKTISPGLRTLQNSEPKLITGPPPGLNAPFQTQKRTPRTKDKYNESDKGFVIIPKLTNAAQPVFGSSYTSPPPYNSEDFRSEAMFEDSASLLHPNANDVFIGPDKKKQLRKDSVKRVETQVEEADDYNRKPRKSFF